MAMRFRDKLLPSMKMTANRMKRKPVLLAGTMLLLASVLLIQIMDYKEASARNAEMTNEIVAYSELAAKVNNSTYRAVQVEQVPQVLGDIVQKAKDCGLMVKIGDNPLYQDDMASIYEIRIKGSWKRTAVFLENLQPRDALIAMRMLDLQGTDEKLETVLQVKVYTK